MKKKIVALPLAPLLALSLSACSGGDGATKEAVTEGMTATMQNQLEGMDLGGLGDDVIQKYASCIIDESYDSLSASTRDVIAKGANEDISELKISEKDEETLMNSMEDCSQTIVDSIIQ